MSERASQVGWTLVPNAYGRPTLMILDVRTPEEVDAEGRPKWEPPAHVRYARRRKHGYLVCGHCGRSHRTLQYFLAKTPRGACAPVAAQQIPPDADGPFYCIGAWSWADKHRDCPARGGG